MTKAENKVCLIVIDGWGISPNIEHNAVANASTPVMTALSQKLATTVQAHGLSVGLPDGVMGNSEVGHLTIGAGRVNYQDLERINFAIQDKTFFSNERLLNSFQRAKSTNNRLHLLGLVSDGGVHSHINHLKQFLSAAKDNGVPECYVHFFSDGRDTAPRSAVKYLKDLIEFMDSIQYGKVASVCGRYYAMDRDNRWNRIETAYNGLVAPVSTGVKLVANYAELYHAIEDNYANEITDEFFTPIVCTFEADISSSDKRNNDLAISGTIRDNDTMILFDFRADRMREIANVLGMHQYPFEAIDDQGESNTVKLSNTQLYCMTQYDSKYTMPVIFPPNNMRNGIAEWLSKKGYSQHHIAETEKYAHVTFFFNGGIEEAFANEKRGMVPSPKVATYDLKPEMNAIGVANAVAESLATREHDFVMCNFAPPDMVGHTGVYDAAVIAVSTTDHAIGVIADACKKYDYTLLITADHGNAEQMLNTATGAPHTAHTSNPVPFYIQPSEKLIQTQGAEKWKLAHDGGLSDIAPTILDIMNIEKPDVMTGKSLLLK